MLLLRLKFVPIWNKIGGINSIREFGMEISMRGWRRNMGTTKIADHDLSEMTLSKDPQKSVYFGRVGLFKSIGEVSVAWGEKLHFTGDYRIQVDFTRSDVAKLFKSMFGSELDVSLLEEYGFTVSPDLKKKLLGEIKLADLTIGDLAGLGLASKQEEPVADEETPGTVKPLFRRV